MIEEPDLPSVDVVMRTRNRPTMLRRALRDLLKQSHSDWRLVVVNDAGDPSLVVAAVEAELPQDERVQILHREKSSGMEAASNAGIRVGSAPLVVVHDDDDTWHPEFLERTAASLQAHQHWVAVATRTEIVHEVIDGDEITETGRQTYAPDIQDVTLTELLVSNVAVPISLVYRRSAHADIGWFDESLPVVGDWDFNLRLAVRGEIGFLDGEPLAFWHQRAASEGVAGNSIIARRREHERFSMLVRDRALRQEAGSEALGSLHHITRLVELRVTELKSWNPTLADMIEYQHHQLDRQDTQIRELQTALEHVVERLNLVAKIKGILGAAGRRLRGRKV